MSESKVIRTGSHWHRVPMSDKRPADPKHPANAGVKDAAPGQSKKAPVQGKK